MDEKIKSRVGEKLVVHVDSLAFGGNGVGRVDGEVVFVPLAAPGDILRVRVTSAKARHLEASIEEILEPSPSRRAPRCSHFGICGGCAWQHVEYATQLEAKRRIVEESLRRIGGLEDRVPPVVASPSEYGYRNRVRLHTGPRGELGYFERASTRLVAVDECPILEPALEARFRELARSPSSPLPSTGAPGSLELSSDEERGQALLPASLDPSAPPFRQVNREVNRGMIAEIRRMVIERMQGRPFRLLDLYCGDGNLSLPLADAAVETAGFDSSRSAVERANADALRHGLRARYHLADIPRAAKGAFAAPSDEAAGGDAPLVVIADPPRAGLGRVAEAVADSPAGLLVYVSCNPPVLARDARHLTSLGFALELVQPFDMFPQTYHVETVALFARAS